MIYEFNLVNNMLRKVHTDSSLNARAAQPTQPTSADNRTVRRTDGQRDGQADKRTALVPSELTNLLAQFSAQGMWQVCPTSTSFEAATSAARTTTSATITATTETTTTTSCLLYDF